MNLLLDTHVLLWWLDDPKQLSAAARKALRDVDNIVYVSAVVAWEIAIKQALGKLDSPGDLEGVISANGFRSLSISMPHVAALRSLRSHHRDPFDRMLISQALHEGLQLVSRDPQIARYQVPLIVA